MSDSRYVCHCDPWLSEPALLRAMQQQASLGRLPVGEESREGHPATGALDAQLGHSIRNEPVLAAQQGGVDDAEHALLVHVEVVAAAQLNCPQGWPGSSGPQKSVSKTEANASSSRCSITSIFMSSKSIRKMLSLKLSTSAVSVSPYFIFASLQLRPKPVFARGKLHRSNHIL